ncbi:response regulator [Spirochaetota bacterium]
MALKILLIDDDENILETTKEILEGYGYEVTVATNGEEGYEYLKINSYDVLITDDIMPYMSGMELIEQIRETHPDMPVILTSGRVYNYNKSEMHSNVPQIRFVLEKPFPVQLLIDSIESCMQK